MLWKTVPRRAWRSPAACRALTPGELIAGLHTMRLLRWTLHIQVGTTLYHHPLLCSSFPDLLRATRTARPLVRLIMTPTTAWPLGRVQSSVVLAVGCPKWSNLGRACLALGMPHSTVNEIGNRLNFLDRSLAADQGRCPTRSLPDDHRACQGLPASCFLHLWPLQCRYAPR